MRNLRQHVKLLGFACLMVLGVVGLCYGSLEENILALVPGKIKQRVALFEHSPLSQKLIVITKAPSAQQAQETAARLQDALAQAGFITPQKPWTNTSILQMLSALPGLFSPKIQQETERKIAPQAVSRQIAQYYEE